MFSSLFDMSWQFNYAQCVLLVVQRNRLYKCKTIVENFYFYVYFCTKILYITVHNL
jgi:hypothetical protein